MLPHSAPGHSLHFDRLRWLRRRERAAQISRRAFRKRNCATQSAQNLCSRLPRTVELSIIISDAARTDKGCYFASVFSTNLSAEKSSFDVLNRIDAQRLLTKAAIRPPDLLKSETSGKVAAVIGVDALLMGTFRQIGSAIALELSLREATTGKELYHTQYQEQSSDEFEALFPAATDSAATIFYFADLDGIGSPECLVCSNPSYTRVAGDKKTQGAVLLSAVFKVNGQLDQARVARSFEPSLDQTAMEVISNWKVEPARDAAGNSVPVRQKVAVDFSLFNSDAGRFGVQRDSAVLPRAGVNGFGVPACVYCPAPDYSNKARADKSRGTVLMDVGNIGRTGDRCDCDKGSWRRAPKRKQSKLLSLGNLDPQKTLQGILSRFAFKSKSLSKSASSVYPPFFNSASTSLANSFSVSNTPDP